ncbi:hypothetical protein APF79_13730 [bacterium BRH_c32]|nr:MAG: hypothetical protein APF79_13730 [bacterium BRH_c32]
MINNLYNKIEIKNMSKKIKSFSPQRKKRLFQFGIGILLVIAIIYLVFANLILAPKPVTEDKTETKEKMVAYNFEKQGELSFYTQENKILKQIDIQIADDDSERATGLMFRDKMEENQGMLFIFPIQTYQSFWMKNTIIPLDIMFVTSDFEIIKIHKNTTPYSEESYPSIKPAMYVVEVIGGFTDKYNINEGDKIAYRRF